MMCLARFDGQESLQLVTQNQRGAITFESEVSKYITKNIYLLGIAYYKAVYNILSDQFSLYKINAMSSPVSPIHSV